MARLPRESKIETREARSRLKVPADREPFWRSLTPGVFLGYRKGSTGGTWVARVSAKSVGVESQASYLKKNLGAADDYADCNGVDILSYQEAFKATLAYVEELKNYDKPSNYTVAEAVAHYLNEHYRKVGRDPQRTEGSFRVHILPALGSKTVASLTQGQLEKWLLALASKPPKRGGQHQAFDTSDSGQVRQRRATANRQLNHLKAALNHAHHRGRVANDRAWRLLKPFRNVDEARVRYLSVDETRRLLNASDAEFRPMIRAALLSGCRYGELCNLKVGDVDLDAGTLYLSETKSGKPRYIPLTSEGRAWFGEWVTGKQGCEYVFCRDDGTAWGKSHQSRRMELASAGARIEPAVTFHVLRHTYASLLASNNVSLMMIAEVLGHSDSRLTSKHYAHLQPSALKLAIEANLPAMGMPDSNVTRIGKAS